MSVLRGGVGRTVAVLLMVGVAGCADPPDEVSVERPDGGEIVVNWSEGQTYEEQVEEIKLVNEVMVDHFGEDVLPQIHGEPWDLQEYLAVSGIPDPSTRAVGHYFFEISYDFSGVEPSQETVNKALAVLEEIGLTPNRGLQETYQEDRDPVLRVAGGREEHGRVFVIEQRHPDADIKALSGPGILMMSRWMRPRRPTGTIELDES
ncbi:hypothetical protein [Nesterenkonia sp. PF2B19]|uniref:hypothetical protein n=1 Tax=Nesterenkonia sp. PF2B19 TaxID=1881858 RepID=UPI00111C1684|nr:hypothetical protein [Nesterenkonia sp. PF2B19]